MLAFSPWVIGGVAALVLLPLLVLIWVALSNAKTEPDAPPVWTGGLPLIGHFHKFAKNPLGTIREGYKKHGGVFTMKFLNNNITFLIGPKAQEPFFRADDEELSQNEPYKFMTPIFGRGIVFDAPLYVKNQQLRFVAHALKGTALKSYVPHIVSEVEAYLSTWGESGVKDFMDEMAKLTILTASRCLLGREIREHLFGEFSELFKIIDDGINPIAVFFPNAPLPVFWRRDAARREISKIFKPIIAARRLAKDKPQDMLQVFIDAEYKDGSKCDDEQIVGMLIGVLFAGQHTSGITSTWTLLNLVHHQSVMRRVLAEQLAVLGPRVDYRDTTGLNFDSLKQMNLLNNCAKESLRMSPPLIMLMRKVHVPLRVGDFTVPRDHLVFTSPAVSMNLPDDAPDAAFKNPRTFDPDRYSAPRNEGTAPFSFIAFGGGNHACLGEQFGYIQVKTIVSTVLRMFELEKVADTLPEPNYQAMVVGPVQDDNKTKLRFKRRTVPLGANDPALQAMAAELTAQMAAARAAAEASAASTSS